MNLWNWYNKLERDLREAGQEASAELLEHFTDLVCDLKVAEANALLPEVKALTKSLGNPWLEVFVGHWEMRNRVNNLEGESFLADAVALFERAHRSDAIDCPQSVCVTQDLAACYANTDGIGWAQERREVVEETLRRINPNWNCYICLSNEYAESLQDEGRHQEAFDYLDAREAELRAADVQDLEALESCRADSLLALGRYNEALALVEAQEARVEGAEWRQNSLPRTLRKAQLLAHLGRDSEAWELLPAWNELVPLYYPRWCSTLAVLLPRMTEHNTWQIGRCMQTALDHFARSGAYRSLVNCAVLVADLALQRQVVWSAERCLQLARAHLHKLRADHQAAAKLDALAQRIAEQSNELQLPVPAEQLLEWLEQQEGQRNPEVEVQWLREALRQRPDDQALLELTASALQACSADPEANELLWGYVKRHCQEESGRITFLLLNALLRQGDAEQVLRLGECYAQSEPAFQYWCQARLAEDRGQWAEVITHCQTVLAEQPQWLSALHLMAQALFKEQRFAESADCHLELASRAENPNSSLWDHMTAASAASDWDAVRATAKRLDMELSGEQGPIEEDWGWVIIRFYEEGEAFDYYAQRTGPVTARILENASPRHTQHAFDEVVFDAGFLETPPEDEEERKNFVYSFAAVHSLKSGDYSRSWVIEGLDPGEERLDALREALRQRQCHLWVHQRGYAITDQADESRELTGIVFTLSAPSSLPALALHEHLQALTGDLHDTLCWRYLAEHIGADTAPHDAYLERYTS